MAVGIVGGFQIAGAALSFLGAIEQQRQARIQAGLTSSLSGLNIAGIQAQQGTIAGQRRRGIESFGRGRERLGLEEDRLGLQERQLGIQRKGIGLGRESLDLQREGSENRFQTESELLESQKESSLIQRSRQLFQEGSAEFTLGLRKGQATQLARVESEQVAIANAAIGRGAFGRAFSQMNVNQFATLEQQTRGLEKEKLLSTAEFSETEKRFMTQLRGMEKQFQLELSEFDIAGERFGLAENQLALGFEELGFSRTELRLQRQDLSAQEEGFLEQLNLTEFNLSLGISEAQARAAAASDAANPSGVVGLFNKVVSLF